MLPQVVSLTNTPNGSHSGGEDLCDSSSSSSHSRLLHQSIACLPSSSNSSWFHGTLSRTEADHILMNGTPGSFLVRQQDPSRFYIDIATAKGVEHHPVKRLGRQYFYSGKCYSSLSDLVSLFNERGGEPITTSQYKSSNSQSLEEDDLPRCIAQSAYNGDPINNELSTYIGDVITLLEKPDADWVLSRNNRTNETGYVPSNILDHLIDGIEDLAQIAYTHGPEVTDVLHQMRVCRGSFLIRPSSRGADSWAILVNVGNDQVKKFLIKQARDEQGGWILSGRRFPSVQHIIDRYCYHPILHDVRLCHAVLANRPESRSLSASSDASPEEEVKVFPESSAQVQSIASIVALRKSRDDKPWKTCHLTLRNDPQGSCQLIMANDAEHQKVRSVYKLPFCILYNLEESVFDQEGCFYLSPTDIHCPGTYICIQPFYRFAEWISYLRPRVQALRIGDLPLFDGFRFELPEAPAIAIWKIHLDKFESDTLKADNLYSANVTVNGVKICSSAMLTPSTNRAIPAIIFDSSFVIPFAPCINSSVQVNIVNHQKGKNVRPFTVSPLMQMPLSDTTKYTLSNGICLRMSCSRISVLSEQDYLSIQDWLETYPIAFLEYVSDNLSPQDRSLFSQCIVCHLFSQPNKLLDLVEAVLTPTLASSAAESALRQDSLATSLISQLLRAAVRSELEKVIDARGLSTSKMADAHDIEFIVLNIISLCQTRIVSQLLRLVKAVTERRFPNDAQAVRRVLCTVLILRFTNPVILTKFNSLPVGQAVAKGVQASANAICAKYLDRDEYQHTAALRRFFDELESVQSVPRETCSPRPAHFDWLAISCHLIHSTMSSRPKETLPHVPDHILRVILSHHAQN